MANSGEPLQGKDRKFFSISRIRTFFSRLPRHFGVFIQRPFPAVPCPKNSPAKSNGTPQTREYLYYSIIPKRIPRTAAHFMNRPAIRHSDGGTGRQRYGGLYERPDGNRTRSMAAER